MYRHLCVGNEYVNLCWCVYMGEEEVGTCICAGVYVVDESVHMYLYCRVCMLKMRCIYVCVCVCVCG